MKHITSWLVITCVLACGAQATTVSDTIYMAVGGAQALATGTITLDFPFYCTGPNGRTVSVTRVPIVVTAGVFTAELEPNDTCNSTYYIATYALRNGPTTSTHREYWIVPTSGSPVTIDTIRQANTPAVPSYQIPVSQLAGAGTLGQLILSTTSSFTLFGPPANGRSIIADSGQSAGWRSSPVLMNLTSGRLDFSADYTKPWKVENGFPPSGQCAGVNDVGTAWYRKDTAASAASLYGCSNTNTGTYAWELLQGSGEGGSTPGGGILHGYATISNTLQSVSATGADTLTLLSTNPAVINVTLGSNDPTYGDYALFDLALGSLMPSHFKTTTTVGGGFYPRVSASDNGQFQWRTPTELRSDISAAPALHASQHEHGGTDPVGTSTPLANGIVKALDTAKIALGWVSEVAGVADLTDYSGSYGSGSTALKATITTPSTGQSLCIVGGNIVNGGCTSDNAVLGFPAMSTLGLVPHVGATGTLAAGELYRSTSTGNYGIGAGTAPLEFFHLRKQGSTGAESVVLALDSYNQGTNSGPLMVFENLSGGGRTRLASIAALDSGSFDGRLVFRTRDTTGSAGTTGLTDKLTIMPSGKVGIGTSAPTLSGTGRLHVNGNTIRPIDTLRTPSSGSDTCYLGEFTFDADYGWACTATNTWKKFPLYSYSGAIPITSASSPTDDTILMGNGTSYTARAIPTCTPGTEYPHYDGSTDTWSCQVISGTGGSGVPPGTIAFTSASTVTIDNTNTGCGHGNIFTELQELISANTYQTFTAATQKVSVSPWTITFTFPSARSGRVLYNCWGGSGSSIGNVSEVDGAPAIANVSSITADQDDGLNVSNPSGTVARIDANFLQSGTGAVSRSLRDKLRDFLPSIHEFNPDPTKNIGDGSQHPLSESYASYAAALAACPYLGYEPTSLVTDMATTGWQTEELFTCAANKAVKAQEATGGGLYIPRGHYYTSSQVVLKAPRANGWKIVGDGYNSVIQVRPGGWDTTARSNRRGIVTMDHNYVEGRYGGNVIIRDLRFIGVQNEVASAFDRPHAIYGSDASVDASQKQYNVNVSDCYFQNFDREALWQSASESSLGWSVDRCHFLNVTTGIQAEVDGMSITNNEFRWDENYDGGTDMYGASVAVAATGHQIVVSGNHIYYPELAGIYMGDGVNASVIASNNHVYINGNTDGGSVRACFLASILNKGVIEGNVCRIYGDASTVGTFGVLARYNGDVQISNNLIEITSRGTGIRLDAQWYETANADVSGTLKAALRSNTIRYLSQSAGDADVGIKAQGIGASTTGVQPSLILDSSNNVVDGLDSNDTGIDYGHQDVTATTVGDMANGGAAVIYGKHRWFTPPATTIVDSTNTDPVFMRAANVGMLRLAPILQTFSIFNDQISLGAGPEILTNGALTSGTSWSAAGDFALSSDAATYTHSAGSGTITQASGSFATTAAASTRYRLEYQITAASGTAPTCVVTTAFAVSSTSLTTSLGSWSVEFVSAASPGDFVISCTSAATGSATFDALTLTAASHVYGYGPNRRTLLRLDTQGAAASDDLATISGGQDGDLIVIGSTNNARVINVTSAGNISVPVTLRLTSTLQRLWFIYDATAAKWLMLSSTLDKNTSGYLRDIAGKVRVYDSNASSGVSNLEVVSGGAQSTNRLFAVRDGTTDWSQRICYISSDYAFICDALTTAVTTARTTFNTLQSSTTFLGSNGQIVQQFRNRDTTTNNWAIQAFQDGAGTVAAAFGVQYTDQTSHYGTFSFRTRAADGLLERGGYNATGVFTMADAYAAGWDGSTNVPTKDAVYDEVETRIKRSGSISSAALNAAVTTANLVASAAAGTYRVTASVQTTTAAAGACTSDVTIGWTYNGGAKTKQIVVDHNQAVDEGDSSGSWMFRADSANITYAVSLDAGGDCTNTVYDLSVVAERMQ